MGKEIIQQLLETEYSDTVSVRKLSLQPKVNQIELGADNVLFNVEDQYIVKIYPDKPTEDILQSVDLMREYNSRSIVHLNNQGQLVTIFPEGGSFIVMDLLKGEHPASPIIQSEYKDGIISALKKLESFSTNTRPQFYNFYEQTFQRLNGCKKFADPQELDTINQLISAIFPVRKDYMSAEPIVVSHHDFKPENILFFDNKDYFLLDWDKAVRSYYLDDVARTTFFFSQTEDNIDSKSVKFFFDSFPQRWKPSVFLYSLAIASLDVFSEIYLCTKDPKMGEALKAMFPKKLQPQFLLECSKVILNLNEKNLS